jgi:hypothetical protein
MGVLFMGLISAVRLTCIMAGLAFGAMSNDRK